jgi:hypothetical protein
MTMKKENKVTLIPKVLIILTLNLGLTCFQVVHHILKTDRNRF